MREIHEGLTRLESVAALPSLPRPSIKKSKPANHRETGIP